MDTWNYVHTTALYHWQINAILSFGLMAEARLHSVAARQNLFRPVKLFTLSLKEAAF